MAGELVVGALEDADRGTLTKALRGVDAVAHLAALTHVSLRGEEARHAFERVNVEGTRLLLEAASNAGVQRFVQMSSVKVNGEETRPGERFAGVDTPAPEDDYGRTKHAAEMLVRASGIESVILRPPMVYGADVAGNFARLVAAVRRGVPLPFGAIDNRRSLISVDNLSHATLAALTHPDAAGAVVTLSDDDDRSTAALVRAIGMAIGRPARLVPVPVKMLRFLGGITGRQGAVRRLVGNLQVDNNAARAALDWTPRDRLESALRRMLAPR
jgi:nucleoside-diphosphate-sugar epimerase